jgi:hypothetical protein
VYVARLQKRVGLTKGVVCKNAQITSKPKIAGEYNYFK